MNIIAERGSVGIYEFPPEHRTIQCNCGPVTLAFPRMLLGIFANADSIPRGYIFIPEFPVSENIGTPMRLAPFRFCSFIGPAGELPTHYDRSVQGAFGILRKIPATPLEAMETFWETPFLPFIPKIKVSKQLCITGKKQWSRLSKENPSSFQDLLDFDHYAKSHEFIGRLIYEDGIPKVRVKRWD